MKLIQYIGLKLIGATPMTLGDYNSYRGWDLPENEDPNRQGYLVEYPLVGEDDKPNHKDHQGYVSWSPAPAFEKSYLPVEGLSKEGSLPILSFFKFAHLPEGKLRDTSMKFAALAIELAKTLPPGAELSAGLRKLLEAKDCAVRAAL